MQNSNPNKAVIWGINTYKVDDPILFNESNIFSPLIHNNSKGRIVGIHPEQQRIRFDIELEESINEIDAWGYDFELIGESESERLLYHSALINTVVPTRTMRIMIRPLFRFRSHTPSLFIRHKAWNMIR